MSKKHVCCDEYINKTYLEVIALLNKEVQFVFQLLEHLPLQEGLPLAKSLQTVRLPGQPPIQIQSCGEPS